MPFTLWKPIPHTTTVGELFTTSLLVSTDDPGSGILVRCSDGLEEGSATIVLASTGAPNALKMMGVDDDVQIGAQAQVLLGGSRVHVVAIPHITWKSLGGGLPWRTPIAAVIALLTALLLSVPPLALTPLAALPVAAFAGVMGWFLLRKRIPTRIGPPEASLMTADDVVKRAMPSSNEVPRARVSAARLTSGSRRWAPPVR